MNTEKKKNKKVTARKTAIEPTASATAGHLRVSPQKARLVVNLIKGKHVDSALSILRYSKQKMAPVVKKLLESAIANAKEHKGADIDKLWVTAGYVNMGKTLKRFMPGAHGRANQILKRGSHITVEVTERG
jgi:large subunit ribosomal protein L22